MIFNESLQWFLYVTTADPVSKIGKTSYLLVDATTKLGSSGSKGGLGDVSPPVVAKTIFQFVEIRTENGGGGGGVNEVLKCKIFFVCNSLYWIKCCVVTLLRPPFMRFQLERVELF